MKILYSRSNKYRKLEYQILTSIIKDKKTIFVRKQALSNEGKDHINCLRKNQKSLEAQVLGLKSPRILSYENGNYIDYEYKNKPSFEKLIETALYNKKFSEINSLLAMYLDALKVFKKSSSKISDEFNQIFDPEKIYSRNNKKYDHLEIGIFDLNTDNILFDPKNKDKWLIDVEWLFDFPIPLDYIKFRSLINLSDKLQKLIRLFASNEFKLLEINHDYCIPELWLRVFQVSETDMERYFHYELNFQNRVLSTQNHNPFVVNKELKTIENQLEISSNPFRQFDLHLTQNQKLKNEIKLKRESAQELQKEIDRLKNAKFMKFTNFLNK